MFITRYDVISIALNRACNYKIIIRIVSYD